MTELVGPPADMWTDAPYAPGPGEDPEDRHGTATEAQLKSMHAKFTELGITNRDVRLAVTRRLLGLEHMRSSIDLSYAQAGRLLVALEEKARTGEPEVRG